MTTISLFGSWSIARFNTSRLSWAQQSISTRFSWSLSEILWRHSLLQAPTLNNPQDLDLDCLAASFPVQWPAEMRANQLLGSAKPGRVKSSAFLSLAIVKLSTFKKVQFFLAHPVLLGGMAESDSADCNTYYCSVVCPSDSVCMSICRLLHSCILLKPLDGMRCHLARTPVWYHLTLY